jgi:DNA-binding transcriptional LysR family regulator
MLVSLPAQAVRPFLNSGLLTVLPFRLDVKMDAFGLITRRGRTLSPGAQALMGALREADAELRGAKARAAGIKVRR